MGNCIRKESSLQWGGEDWASFDDKNCRSRASLKRDNYSEENVNLLGESRGGGVLSSASPTGTEVRVKISKKQLEELLKKADVSVDDLLAHLINGGDGFAAHQPPWRPALQSIPE